jgi:DUF1680 family protein
LLGGTTVLELDGTARPPTPWGRRAYRSGTFDSEAGRPMTLAAVPYHTWANRQVAAMRVWVAAR